MELYLNILRENVGQGIHYDIIDYTKILAKIQEELLEVYKGYHHRDSEEVGEELFDVLQTTIQALYQLQEREGVNIKELSVRHNKKLQERGWNYEKSIDIKVEE